MAKPSMYEELFKAKYPHARTVEVPARFRRTRYTVMAGDYPCSEAYTKAGAYRLAYEYEQQRLITPDPTETATNL